MHALRKDIRTFIEKIIRVNVVRYTLTTIYDDGLCSRDYERTPTLYIYLFNTIIV